MITQTRAIKILLIEDNEGDVILTRETLKEGKILNELVCVKDGESALAYLEQIKTIGVDDSPDLILLDINLPRLSGHELMEFINQDQSLKQIPVFMLTSSDAQRDIDCASVNQVTHYLIKPLCLEEFMEGIKKIGNFWINIIKTDD